MLPLDGFRAWLIADTPAGGFAGRLLRELGARVELLEPPGGTPLRSCPPFLEGGESAVFRYLADGLETRELAARPDASQVANVEIIVHERAALPFGWNPIVEAAPLPERGRAIVALTPYGRAAQARLAGLRADAVPGRRRGLPPALGPRLRGVPRPAADRRRPLPRELPGGHERRLCGAGRACVPRGRPGAPSASTSRCRTRSSRSTTCRSAATWTGTSSAARTAASATAASFAAPTVMSRSCRSSSTTGSPCAS